MHESDKKTLHRITKQASKVTKSDIYLPLMICIVKLSQRKLNILCQTVLICSINTMYMCIYIYIYIAWYLFSYMRTGTRLRALSCRTQRWKLIGTTGGDIVTGLPASSLFVYSGYPAVARFITDQKVRVHGGIQIQQQQQWLLPSVLWKRPFSQY